MDLRRRVEVGSQVAAAGSATAIAAAALVLVVPGAIRRVAVPVMLLAFSLAFVSTALGTMHRRPTLERSFRWEITDD